MRHSALALLIGAAALFGCTPETTAPAPAAKRGDKPQSHLVETITLLRRDITHTVERSGTLRALREARLFSQEEGAVLEVPFREGDRVQAGAVLVRLDDRLLVAELAKASARREQLASDLKRQEQLRQKALSSEEALVKARTELAIGQAEERILATRRDYMTITAPFAGQVAERLVNTGDIVPKNHHVVTLVDSSSLVVEVNVSELLLPGIRFGDPVGVRIDALGQQSLDGEVSRIFPTIDPVTRLGRIEVSMRKLPEQARAGQFCRVTLASRRQDALILPLAALRRDERGEFVYRVRDDKAQRIDVRTGVRTAEGVEVMSGLKADDRVVTAGFLGLRDGLAVRDAVADRDKLSGQGASGHAIP